jgi:hypothetical protein
LLRDIPQEPNRQPTDAGLGARNPVVGSRRFLLDDSRVHQLFWKLD